VPLTWIVLSLWLQLSSLPGSVKPTAQASRPAAQESPPKESQPIVVSDIPERLRQSAAVVRAASTRAEPLNRIQEIERDLPALAASLKELNTTTRDSLAAAAAPGLVTELASAWSVNRRKLDSWQSTLRDRSASLQQDLTELQKEAEVWTVTRTGAAGQQLPDEIVARIAQVLEEIKIASQAVLTRRNAILDTQNKISALRVDVDRAAEEIEVAAGAQRDELFRFDSPPIWKAVRIGGPRVGPLPKEVEAAPATEAVKYYFRTILIALLFQVFAFCLVLAGLLLLRRRGSEWLKDEDGSIRAAGAVVKRPVSASLLLTILGGAVLHGQAPEFIAEIAGYLMLIPLLRLIPKILSEDVKPALWLLAALYVADNSLSLLSKYTVAARCLVLAMAAATVAGLWWIDRRLRARFSPGGWLTITLIFVRLGVGLLVIAFFSELIGATLLGEFLHSGVLKTIYGAVLIYGAMRILQGFMQIILRARPGESAILAKARTAGLMRTFLKAVHFLTFAAFLVLVADSFHIGSPIAAALLNLFERRISIGAFAFSLGSVLTFVLVILASLLLSRVLIFFLSASVYARIALQRGSAESLSKIIHYSIVLAGFLLALGAAGIDLSKFTLMAGALGVGIGFGMQNIVNNFISGLILLIERPLHVGDNITVGTTSGQVADIGIRASTIRTWDGADVIMPNATLISNEVTNWTLSDAIRRCELRVGVAYGTDPDRVIQLLKATILEHPLILKEPAATAHVSGFAESSINFIARFWALVDLHVDVTSELHVAVCKRLASEGIEIPFPQRDLNLRSVDPAVKDALFPDRNDLNG